MKRTITIDSEFYYAEKEHFFLSFPYIFFGIKYIIRKRKKDGKRITTYRPENLAICFSTDSKLKNAFQAALPNIYNDNGYTCINLSYKEFSSVEDLAKDVVNCYWNTAFDPSELESFYVQLRRKTLSNFKSWHKKTKNKPDWVPTDRDMLKIKELDDIFEIKKL